MSSPKEFHMDAVYPEPLSRLRRGHGLSTSCNESTSAPSYRRAVRKQMHRGHSSGVGRFRTQPVTFHEIKEVDEENLAEIEIDKTNTIGAASRSESDLKARFEQFYRSIGDNTANNNDQSSSPSSSNEASTSTASQCQNIQASTSSVATTSNDNCHITSTLSNTSSTVLRKTIYSQDDSSTKTCPQNTNINFNQNSRPYL